MRTVSELLHALLLESANDAAVALAIAASGSIENFAKKCNEKAQSLQLRDTNFTNPHGLYEREHYTTAYDLAIISAQAMKIPQIREITAKKSATVPLGVTKDNPDGEGVRRLNNHNKMLSRYEGAIGIKTGFTKKSGRCLVSAAERDSLTLIAVTLNAPDDWNDHKRLLDFGFSRFERRTVFGAGEFCFDFPLSNANEEYIRAVNLSPIELTVPKTARSHSHCVEAGFRFAVAPVKAGQILGELTVEIDGKIRRSTLVAEKSVGSKDKKRSLLDFIKIKD
jgi:D-alanyl-D-alanine carboxypeptidase